MTPAVTLPPTIYRPTPGRASIVLPPLEPGPTRLHPALWLRDRLVDRNPYTYPDPTAEAALGRLTGGHDGH